MLVSCKDRADVTGSDASQVPVTDDKPSVVTVVPPETRQKSDEKVKELIGQLESPNLPVNPEAQWPVSYPDGYDHDAQSAIEQVIIDIKDEEEKAIPLLLSAVKDEKYCLSKNEETLKDYTVGEVCRQILVELLTHDEMKEDTNYKVYILECIDKDQGEFMKMSGNLEQIQQRLMDKYLANQPLNGSLSAKSG